MNLCTNQNLLLWKVKKTEHGYEMYLSVKGFFCLRPILRKTGTRLRVLEKRGVPFIVHRYRKYRVFQGGVFICSVAIWIASCFIWDISLTGNYMITNDNLYDFLKEKAVTTGIRKTEVDCMRLEEEIRAAFPDITWVSARIEGVKLEIEVNENLLLNSSDNENGGTPQNETYDLCSAYDGIIRQMIIRSGTGLVKVGTEVKKGDKLVSGELVILNDSQEPVNVKHVKSDADIYIETVLPYSKRIEHNYTKKYYTGETVKTYEFLIQDRIYTLPVLLQNGSYDILKEWKSERKAELFQKRVSYAAVLYKEKQYKKAVYSENEVQEMLRAAVQKFIKELEEKGVQIIENNVTIKSMDTYTAANGTIKILVKNEGKQETK